MCGHNAGVQSRAKWLALPLALSEIEVLCRRFGGRLRLAVVVTAAEPRRDSPAIYQRAKDLGITLIGGDVLRTGKLAQCLRRAAK